MKVYIQIGSTRDRIEFDLKPSDTIKVVKAKIAEDRGIPAKIQKMYKNYQAINDPYTVIRILNHFHDRILAWDVILDVV